MVAKINSAERLRGQIKEAYEKLLYTYQTQQEAATLKRDLSNRLSIAQIVLTAICADRLWVVLQDYISLLTDFDDIGVEEIRRRRDLIQGSQAEVYREAPRTDDKAYSRARDRLKNGHQSFEPGECDKLLPLDLRGVDDEE